MNELSLKQMPRIITTMKETECNEISLYNGFSTEMPASKLYSAFDILCYCFDRILVVASPAHWKSLHCIRSFATRSIVSPYLASGSRLLAVHKNYIDARPASVPRILHSVSSCIIFLYFAPYKTIPPHKTFIEPFYIQSDWLRGEKKPTNWQQSEMRQYTIAGVRIPYLDTTHRVEWTSSSRSNRFCDSQNVPFLCNCMAFDECQSHRVASPNRQHMGKRVNEKSLFHRLNRWVDTRHTEDERNGTRCHFDGVCVTRIFYAHEKLIDSRERKKNTETWICILARGSCSANCHQQIHSIYHEFQFRAINRSDKIDYCLQFVFSKLWFKCHDCVVWDRR